jgi:ribosomal protein S27E
MEKNGRILKTTSADITIQCKCGNEFVEEYYGQIFFSVSCKKCGNIMYINVKKE